MPLKLSVGLTKKVGQPDFGSLGAACSVECELDSSLLSNPDGFHEHVRRTYAACSQAVNDELARQQNNGTPQSVSSRPSTSNGRNGDAASGDGGRAGNGQRSERQATQSQVRAIRAIAGRRGLELTQILRNGYGVDSPESLSLTNASQLIDELKQPAGAAGGRT